MDYLDATLHFIVNKKKYLIIQILIRGADIGVCLRL